jgi:thioredoxin 1
MANVIHFGSRKALEETVDKNHVVVVDYWATWCGPCKMIAPAIEKLAADYDGKAVVGKVDIDQLSDLAQEAGIMSIPCVIVFKDGVEYDRIVGASPYPTYTKLIDEVLG